MDLSVCMIVKNEQETLSRALSSVQPIADEIVVVDTGSTDSTKEIASKFTDKIYDFKWSDDFAAARNCSLDHATKSMILWLDADDFIPEKSAEKIAEINASNCMDGYFFNILNINPCRPDLVHTEPFRQFRMFPNISGLRFEGKIHESIYPKCKELGIKMSIADVLIEHHGYKNPAIMTEKIKRNNRLLSSTFGFSSDVKFYEFDCGNYYCLFAESGLLIWEDFHLVFSNVIPETSIPDVKQRARIEIERLGVFQNNIEVNKSINRFADKRLT